MLEPTKRTLLTVPEACKSLGISRATLYSLISQKRLQVVKIGPGAKAGVRFRPQDLDDFAERHVVRERSDSPPAESIFN